MPDVSNSGCKQFQRNREKDVRNRSRQKDKKGSSVFGFEGMEKAVPCKI